MLFHGFYLGFHWFIYLSWVLSFIGSTFLGFYLSLVLPFMGSTFHVFYPSWVLPFMSSTFIGFYLSWAPYICPLMFHIDPFRIHSCSFFCKTCTFLFLIGPCLCALCTLCTLCTLCALFTLFTLCTLCTLGTLCTVCTRCTACTVLCVLYVLYVLCMSSMYSMYLHERIGGCETLHFFLQAGNRRTRELSKLNISHVPKGTVSRD